jgi:lipopolysaccharide export system protein LptC
MLPLRRATPKLFQMLSVRQRILSLTMAAVGALAWWLQQQDETPGPNKSARERRPDYRIDNFSATQMDESGEPHRRLSAVELRHYPDDDSNEIESPRLTLFEQSGPPWLVRSETAWVSGDGNLIRLHGEVFIDREPGARTRPVHIKTREVLLKRDEDYAETDQPVRIASELDWTTSDKGAQLWLEETLRMKLLGRVRGEMIVTSGEENPARSTNGHPRKQQ